MLLLGDGADEVAMGYIYTEKHPSLLEAHEDTLRLLQFPTLPRPLCSRGRQHREIHYFDVLRADRAVSCHGLETRVPFLDHKWVEFYLSIPVDYRYSLSLPFPDGTTIRWFRSSVPKGGFTKALIREAFEETGLLPKEALWRRKEAFSDGVSSSDNSWYAQVQAWAHNKVCFTEKGR